MAKQAPDISIDAYFDFLDQCDRMYVCSSEPANFAAIAAATLATATMTPDTDYTKANGDVSGRKMTTAAKNGVSVTATGTATHIVLGRTTDSTLRYVTTCTSQALTSGNTVNIPAWKVEVADPT